MVRGLVCAIGFLAVMNGAPVEAGFIESACLKANRPAASRKLCRCIDKVAKDSMSRLERKRTAKFFSDPHEAQVVRQSSRPSDEKLWKNYKTFSQRAAKSCS